MNRELVPITGGLARWAVMLLLLGGTIALNFWMQPRIPGATPLAPFFPMLIVVGFLSGLGPALAGLLLSAAAVAALWPEPLADLAPGGLPADLAALAMDLAAAAVGVAVAVFARHLVLVSRQTRARLDLALAAGRMTTWEWDLRSGRMSTSASAVSLFGMSWTDSRSAARLVHPEDLAAVRAGVKAALEGAGHYAFTSRAVRPDTGEVRWVETRAFVHRGASGKPRLVTGVTVDVTDRHEALQASRAAEQRFQVALRGGSIVAWECDAHKRYTWVYSAQPGFRGEDFKGRGVGEVLSRHQQPGFLEAVDRVLASGRAERVPITVEEGGELRHFLSNIDALKDEAGRITGLVGASMDVTELRRTEDALRRSETLYRTLGEAVPDFVWATDAVGVPVHVNRRWMEYTGLTLEQFRQVGWKAVHHPDDRELVATERRRAMAGGEPSELELRYRRHDGVYRWFVARAVPVKDAEGRVTQWVGTLNDITERREAEAQARRLATIVEGTPDFVAVGGAEGRIRYINAAGRRALGIPDGADLAALPLERLCPPWAGERLQREWMPAALADGSVTGEAALLSLDGREIPVSFVLLVQRDAKGQLESVSTIARDIGERLRVQQALQDESRRKDEFLATLAHELRNPMAPIRYAAATLREGMPAGSLQQVRQMIERQSAQMSHLLDDLLDMSRVTRDVIKLEHETLDLRTLAREAAEAAKSMLEAAQHRVVLSTPPEPLWVRADRTRLLQVLGNLLDNAAKYTDPGGRIELWLEREDGVAALHVRDNGIGLSPEMLPRVFDLFSQAHAAHGVSRGGLGIGLTLVKRLVELHGGSVAVASAGLGQGTEFSVRLPLAAAPGRAAAGQDDGKVVGLYQSRPRVLVVDDNRDAAESLAMLLRNEGFPVHVAHDGLSGLAAFERLRPAIALLDIGLPDIDGDELARRILAGDAGRSVKLVAITGWGQEQDRQRTRDAGFDLHLVKPVEPAQLLAAMESLVAELARAPRSETG